MTLISKLRNAVFLALGILLLSPIAGPAANVFGVVQAQAQTINRIAVEGNVRVDDATVISYLTVRVGDQATSASLAQSTSALLNTGLFSSVNIAMSGSTLRVRVTENAIVGSVLFEGNQRFSDDQLIDMVDSGTRGVFTPERLSTDEQTIRLAYSRAGFQDVSVTSRTEMDDNGRVRVIFVINEGARASIAKISFSGNNTFDSNQLKNVIGTKESHFMSWLFQDDSFDEDRLTVDGELIRLYYANHGYPDAQILSAVSEFDPAQNAHFISFTISEGEKYTFGQIGIETSIVGLNAEALKGGITTNEGSTYSLARLQKSAENLAVGATDQGYAFADVRPRVDRDVANHTFNITYLVDEGARVYVERINISGNNKTRDFVIRRELDFAEGDPFNRTLISRGKTSIESLGLFSSVQMNTSQGSAADKVVINVAVVESSSGDYGITAGYDTQSGVLGELSLTERNFLGRGQYLRASIGASQTGKTYELSFTEPRFMGLKISSGFDIYSRVTDERSTNFYGVTSTGGQVRVGVPLTSQISTTFFAGLEQKTFKDNDPTDSAIATDGQERLTGTVGYTLVFNGVDDVKRPSEGLYATLTQKYAGIDNNYLLTEGKARYFVPLFEDSRIVASVKGQVGVISDFSGAGVQPTESFFMGSNLVRGFQSGGMGARAASGEALGATFYAGISGEIEFPIPSIPENWGLKGAVWADTGYVGSPSALAPAAASGMTQQWRSSIGASIVWDSPFGPLRGDFAHVIQQDTGDKTQMFALTLKTLL